jgi:hypothetical protein
LTLRDVSTLNKGQPSFKQIKGTAEGERVAHTDVVLTFSRDGHEPTESVRVDVLDVVAAEVAAARDARRQVNVGHLYAVVAAARLRQGREPLTFDQVAALLDEHHPRASQEAHNEVL